MEAAGVALGGISLVISALENYRTCAKFFSDYANQEALITRKQNYLWLQKEQLEVTLRAIGVDVSTPREDLRIQSLVDIKAHLCSLYADSPEKSEKFWSIIQHMNRISESAASILNGGSTTQSKWPGERTLGLKRRIRRIRLSLDGDKGELTSLLNELQMWNLSLKHCLERVEIPAPGSTHDRAVISMHDQFSQAKCDKTIEYARILHEALARSWSCTCSVPHEGCLRLNWHVEKTLTPAQFEVAMSCTGVSFGIAQVAWKTVKMTVDTAGTQSTPVSTPSQPDPPATHRHSSGKTAKTVRIQDFFSSKKSKGTDQPTEAIAEPKPSPSSSAAPPRQTLNQITILCSSIVGCDESAKDLGYLTCTNAGSAQVYVHNTPVTPSPLKVAPIRTHEHQFSGLTLPIKHRLEIAASLCWAVLLLSNTEWLSSDLTQSELQLLLDSSNPHGQEKLQGAYALFRHGTAPASVASLPPSLASDPSLTAFVRNRTLFVLGILLIELCLGRSFENLKSDTSILIGTKLQNTPNGFGDFDLVSILVDKVYGAVGEQYADAVQRCLRCPFDGRDSEQDLKLPQFRKNFFFGIVAPVQATFTRLSGYW